MWINIEPPAYRWLYKDQMIEFAGFHHLVKWRGSCVDCGTPYTFTSPNKTIPTYPTRRCQRCRSDRKRVRELAKAKEEKSRLK